MWHLSIHKWIFMKNVWIMMQDTPKLFSKAQGYVEIKAETHHNTANSYHPKEYSCGWDNANKTA